MPQQLKDLRYLRGLSHELDVPDITLFKRLPTVDWCAALARAERVARMIRTGYCPDVGLFLLADDDLIWSSVYGMQ